MKKLTVVIVVVLGVLGAAQEDRPVEKTVPQVSEKLVEKSEEASRRHVVCGGESLWRIAKRHYGDGKKWRLLWARNRKKLRSPDYVRPGTVLMIPPADWKPPSQNVRKAPRGYRYWKTVKVRVAAYEPSARGCAPFADGKTSIGRNAWRLDGVAVDPSVIPYGTLVEIPGIGFKKADDTGSITRRFWRKHGVVQVEIRMATHNQARRWGVRWRNVRLYRKTTVLADARM